MSWLDHAIGSTSVHSAISNMDVLYDLLSSDHFPLGMTIEVDGLSKTGSPESMQSLRKLCKVNWSKVGDRTIKQDTSMTDKLLSRINVYHLI